MAKFTLKTLSLAMALFALVGCGESKFTDDRDGKTYATTKIGKRVWMAENLNYATDSSYCCPHDSANCAKYGRLYTWNAAMNACPAGWHLPTSEEWDALESATGEEARTKLKSKEWDGTDSLGFNVLPACSWCSGKFYGEGVSAYFWTATENNDSNAYYRDFDDLAYWRISYDRGGLYSDYAHKNHAYSVRCVKD